MGVKKLVEIPLASILSNNKISKRATGKDPGIDRKMCGGWDVSNNVRTNNFRSKKIGTAWSVLREGKEPRSEGWRKGSLEGREKKGL